MGSAARGGSCAPLVTANVGTAAMTEHVAATAIRRHGRASIKDTPINRLMRTTAAALTLSAAVSVASTAPPRPKMPRNGPTSAATISNWATFCATRYFVCAKTRKTLSTTNTDVTMVSGGLDNLDSGSGRWSLKYDATNSPNKTALSVQKTDSGRWKEATVALRDAHFGNRCPHGTDLMLVNGDAEDDTFHMIEITRKTGDRKGYWGE